MITSAPIVNSGEASAFYWPQIGDPNPAAGHAPDLLGRAARLADLGVRRRPPRQRAAGQDAGHRLLRGELPRVRDLRRRSELRRLPAARRPSASARARTTRVRPDRRPVYGGRPHGRLDVVARPRRRRPRHALGGDLGRADLRDPQRRRGGSGDGDLAQDRQRPAHRRGSRAGSTSTRPTPVTRGSATRATTPSPRRLPGHVFEVRENGPAPGSGIFTNLNVEAARPRSRHRRTTATCRRATSSATTLRTRCTCRRTSACSAATTTGKAAGTSRPACRATRSCTSRSGRRRAFRRAPSAGTASAVLYAATHSQGIWQMKVDK